MISVELKKNRITKLPSEVLDRLSHPDAAGNEAYKFLLEWAGELFQKINGQAIDLSNPVTNEELRQVRGSLHVLGAIKDAPQAAEYTLKQRVAKAAEEEKHSQRNKP